MLSSVMTQLRASGSDDACSTAINPWVDLAIRGVCSPEMGDVPPEKGSPF